MVDATVHACLIVDDVPYNPTYWWRCQQAAFGYDVPEIGYGGPWRRQAVAPHWPPAIAQAFADFVEEFGLRGKLTLLPCPAGHGRIDQTIRGYPPDDLAAVLDVVRSRLAPRFDITPEVLTHSMALDIRTGGLLPHSESAWLSCLARTQRLDELATYLRHGWQILHNVGIEPHGVTIGGMTDPSGIAKGEMLLSGCYTEVLARVLLDVEREFDPKVAATFTYSGAPYRDRKSESLGVPEVIYTAPDGAPVYELHSAIVEPLISIWYGEGDENAAIDAMVTPELAGGRFIEEAEAGRAVVVTVHAQTLNALNTGRGLRVLREAVRRFSERYGKRLAWHTPRELAAVLCR